MENKEEPYTRHEKETVDIKWTQNKDGGFGEFKTHRIHRKKKRTRKSSRSLNLYELTSERRRWLEAWQRNNKLLGAISVGSCGEL